MNIEINIPKNNLLSILKLKIIPVCMQFCMYVLGTCNICFFVYSYITVIFAEMVSFF